MPTIDTNIDNYTISELLTILDLNNNPTINEINEKTDFYINKYTHTNEIIDKEEMIDFFYNIKNTLLQYIEDLYITPQQLKQTNNWFENQSLKQNTTSVNTKSTSNTSQINKITERKQKIDIYNDNHLPMNREQLGINNTHEVPIAQDVLNPNLKNITSRIIVLDSQYRQSSCPTETSSDYILDLSEPLLNVLSLRLYSFSIPYTWYVIDEIYGNNYFWIIFNDSTSIKITIESGNYSTSTFTSTLITSISKFLLPSSTIPSLPFVDINPNNGKITLNLYSSTRISDNKIIDETTIISFFNINPIFDPSNNVCVQTIAINQTLGWIMGFRIPCVNVNTNGNTAISLPDLYGPKYFILVIDDLNQNHINNGLIGITEMSKTLKLPNYYTPDLPYICTPAINQTQNSNMIINTAELANDADAGILIVDKLNITYSPIQTILPSAPRTLTQSQIYTINEIIKNNKQTYNYKLKAPVVSDTFAILPIKLGNMRMGDVNTEFGGSMQDNKRIYFGPVNISRLRIKLLDDKGNIINLNGADWCVTIISENLYQY